MTPPATELQYTFRMPGPAYYERARRNTARLEVYRSGAIVAPTVLGSTYSLWEPDEDIDTGTPLVSSQPIVLGADNAACYDLLASYLLATLTLGRGYVERWHLVLPDSTTRDIMRPVALVRRALHPVITDNDVDPRGRLAIHRAPGFTSWQTYIDAAWTKLLHRLEQRNRWPETLWNPGDSFELHLSMVRIEIYEECARAQGGKWIELLGEERKNAHHLWQAWTAKLDSDQDGRADSQDQVGMSIGTVFAGGPRALRLGQCVRGLR